MNKNNSAFTILEILVVLAMVVFLATMVSPWLFKKKPAQDWPTILDRFNSFLFFARQEAISTNKVFRVVFKMNKKEPDSILVQEESQDPENPDKIIYQQTQSEYFKTQDNLPEEIRMVAFYKGKVEQFAENKGNGYCHVIPNGLVEEVMIYLIRKVDDKEEKATFKISPFVGKFDFYEGFLKPEK
jgi:hypothetical protein